MTTHRALLVAAMLLALASQAFAQKPAAGAGKKVYCWNEGGRKVCGDALPATAVDSARREISASGLTTRELGSAPTADERAAAAVQARIDAEAAATVSAQARRDLAMAESYDSEEQLRRAFQLRITLIDEIVKASQLGIEGQRRSLLNLLQRASEIELTGKPVNEALAASIQTQHQALLRQQGMLADQRRDRSEIEGDLAAALQRYREMKGDNREG
ncbi:MAG: hypothetical protein M3374_01775 [Pseudomonadota bacterium]|nr:hypothetical protein [Pseudomonadota bacterium]